MVASTRSRRVTALLGTLGVTAAAGVVLAPPASAAIDPADKSYYIDARLSQMHLRIFDGSTNPLEIGGTRHSANGRKRLRRPPRRDVLLLRLGRRGGRI